MAVLLVIAMTVNFFGESNVWFMILVGILATFAGGVRLDRSGALVLDPASPLVAEAPSGVAGQTTDFGRSGR